MLTSPALKFQVNSIWNRFWSGGISNPLTAIEQMSYLIFLKRLENMYNVRVTYVKRRKIEIQLLSLPLQQKFATILEQVEQLRAKQRESEKGVGEFV